MKPVLVWDLPTRLFHWLLVAGCGAAFVIACTSSEHSAAFVWHMLCGLFLLPLLLFRLIWGVTGSRYAQFRALLRSPREVFGYLAGMVNRTTERYIGHNPVAGYAILAMLVMLAGSVVSGLLVSGSEMFEDLHVGTSYLLLGIVGVHILGVLTHMVFHRENVIFSMITGKKLAEERDGIPSSHLFVALCLLVLAGTSSAALIKNYESTGRKLLIPVVGASIALGENEQSHGADQGENENDDDND